MNSHFHFLGICGTAMGAVAAAMARRGFTVTGGFSIYTCSVRGEARDGRKICFTVNWFWIGILFATVCQIRAFGRIYFFLRGRLLSERFL